MPRIPISNTGQVSTRVERGRGVPGQNPVYSQLAQLGNMGMNMANEMMAKEKKVEEISFMNSVKLEADQQFSNILKNVKNSDLSGSNWIEEFKKQTDEYQAKLLARAPSSDARVNLQSSLTNSIARMNLNLGAEQAQRKQDVLIETLNASDKNAIAKARNATSPLDVKQSIIDIEKRYTEAKGFMDEFQREKAIKNTKNAAASEYVAGLLEKEDYPGAMRALESSPMIKDNLNLNQLSQYRSMINQGQERKSAREASSLYNSTIRGIKEILSPDNNEPLSDSDLAILSDRMVSINQNKYIPDEDKENINAAYLAGTAGKELIRGIYDSEGAVLPTTEQIEEKAEAASKMARTQFGAMVSKEKIKNSMLAGLDKFRMGMNQQPALYSGRLNPAIKGMSTEIHSLRKEIKQLRESGGDVQHILLKKTTDLANTTKEYTEALNAQQDKMGIPEFRRQFMVPEDVNNYKQIFAAAKKTENPALIVAATNEIVATYGPELAVQNLISLGQTEYATLPYIGTSSDKNLFLEVTSKEGIKRTMGFLEDRRGITFKGVGGEQNRADLRKKLSTALTAQSTTLRALEQQMHTASSSAEAQVLYAETSEAMLNYAMRQYAITPDISVDDAAKKAADMFADKGRPGDAAFSYTDGITSVTLPNNDTYDRSVAMEVLRKGKGEFNIFGEKAKNLDYKNLFNLKIPDEAIYDERTFNNQLNERSFWVNGHKDGILMLKYQNRSGKVVIAETVDGKPVQIKTEDLNKNSAFYSKYKQHVGKHEPYQQIDYDGIDIYRI